MSSALLCCSQQCCLCMLMVLCVLVLCLVRWSWHRPLQAVQLTNTCSLRYTQTQSSCQLHYWRYIKYQRILQYYCLLSVNFITYLLDYHYLRTCHTRRKQSIHTADGWLVSYVDEL